MAQKRRWVEVHRLTISGLEDDTEYGSFLQNTRGEFEALSDAVWEHGGKSHALHTVSIKNNRLRLRFLSFTTGHRPDILDTKGYSISANPLAETQTGIEWTHLLGGRVNGRYLLLCEKVQPGIWPVTLEGYLQWMIDKVNNQQWTDDNAEDDEYISVSLEPETGDKFVERINGLSRIRWATLRTVRPNPGWADLENELSGEAKESHAQKADVTMTAPRQDSLAKNKGIVQAIKDLFKTKKLDYAAIEGERDGQIENFNSKKLVERKRLSFNMDSGGQIQPQDAWNKMDKFMDKQD